LSKSNKILTAGILKRCTNCKFCENRERNVPLRGVYIPHFYQISVKISVFGVLYPYSCTNGNEIWQEGGAKFHPHRCNISPLRGEKRQNRLWVT